MEKSFNFKTKSKFEKNGKSDEVVNFEFKINSNHSLDEHLLTSIETYLKNIQVQNYKKVEK